MDPLRPGQDPERIGTHTLLGRLGAGGMGQVYLARSPDGRLVAVKVIREEITGHRESLARFRREVATVRTVRSAHTARLVDASLDETPYWLATEYVPGPTLRQAVTADGPFAAPEARGLLAALGQALTSVHAYGITHRDLKPHNVILAADGPRLIDFGIARGTDDTALTRTGAAPGSPGFTAPEVLLRNEVSAAADVFALGATMAYATTGRPPFGDGPPEAVSYRAVHEEIDLAGVADADAELAGLIRACVAKDPARRPGIAEVIARAEGTTAGLVASTLLERTPPDPTLLEPTLLEPTPPEPTLLEPTLLEPDRAAPRPRRRRSPWGALAVLLALAGVAGTVASQDWESITGELSPPSKPLTDVRWHLSTNPRQARLGAGDCDRPVDETPPDGSSSSVQYIQGASSVDLEVTASGHDKYRLVVGVKPPGATGVGYTSRPARVGAAPAFFSYPKDFAGAPPVTSAAGDWTVVFYHAREDAREKWTLFACNGFHATRRDPARPGETRRDPARPQECNNDNHCPESPPVIHRVTIRFFA